MKVRVARFVLLAVIAASCGDGGNGESGVAPSPVLDAGDADGALAGSTGTGGQSAMQDAASNAGTSGSDNSGGAVNQPADAALVGDASTILPDGSAQDGGPFEDGSVPDASEPPDAAEPVDGSNGGDANSCPAPAAGELGGPCASDAECDSALGAGDGMCANSSLGWVGWPSMGYCLTVNLGGCPTQCQDVTCPSGGICVELAGCKGCAPACCSNAVCAAETTCSNHLGASGDLEAQACVPGDADASVAAPCDEIADCRPGSSCRLGAEHPGGECSVAGCTPGDDATCLGSGHCVQEVVGTHCAKSCDSDSDCRLAEGYQCVDFGGSIGKICQHGQVGDACASDADCGDAATWDCKTGASFPGGYCTLQAACSTPGSSTGCTEGSSLCYDSTPDFCVDRCATIGGQSTCRSGYTCYDVDPGAGTFGGCLSP